MEIARQSSTDRQPTLSGLSGDRRAFARKNAPEALLQAPLSFLEPFPFHRHA